MASLIEGRFDKSSRGSYFRLETPEEDTRGRAGFSVDIFQQLIAWTGCDIDVVHLIQRNDRYVIEGGEEEDWQPCELLMK